MTDTTTREPESLRAPRHMVRQLLEHLRHGTTQLMDSVVELPAGIYTDPQVARDELAGVFGTVPFIAAHGSEVAEPYDVLAKRLPNNEVIIARQADGSVRTFVNACRHRGSMLRDPGAGHCRVITCAYHAWSYDLDGTLRNITFDETFGRGPGADLNLIELPTEERHGFVRVVDDPAASIDVAAWLGPETDARLAGYGIDQLQCVRSGAFDEPANWKLMQDAFLDGYHIKFLHPKSAARVIHSNTYVMEDYGHHCLFVSPRRSLDQWMEHDPGPDEPMLGHVMMTQYLGPNSTLLQLEDHFELLSFFPISDDPTHSRMEMRVLVPRRETTPFSDEAWTAHWDKNWHILQVVLTGEDFPILRSAQTAQASRAAAGTVLGRNEVNNQVFHREIAALREAAAAARSRRPNLLAPNLLDS